MRKLFLLGILICLCASLAGCSVEADRLPMYIEPAQLTEEEKDVAAMLGLNTEHRIFDFVLDDQVQRLQVNTYERIDGAWEMISGGSGQAFTDAEGRIALGFDKIADGVRIAIQSEGTDGSTSYSYEPTDTLDGLGCATSFLSNKTEIVYEQEIPLVVQIVTAKNQINSYAVEYFNSPEKYDEYEYVYAITVRFSQKTVPEFSASK